MNRRGAVRRLRRLAVTGLLVAGVLHSTPAWGQFGGGLWEETRPDQPSGEEVMRRVRESFPPYPVRVRARLLIRNRRGDVERSLHAGLRLAWGAAPPRLDIVVLDAFGATLAMGTWRRADESGPSWKILLGDPPVEQTPPQPAEPITGTDFTWMDLALDWLWWPNARVTGVEMRKSRRCYVVEVTPPPGVREDLSRARLLVDDGVYALLEAETFDREGRRWKRLEVKSLRKVDDMWMLQDLEIRDFRTGRRTTLRVEEMERDGEALPMPTAPPANKTAGGASTAT